MSQIGPFNTDEWLEFFKKDPQGAQISALDIFKDISLLVEATKPGSGARFQKDILNNNQQFDLNLLSKIDHERTKTPPFLLYEHIPVMLDISSYLTFGHPFRELQSKEKEKAREFGLVIDLSHFSRIMGKMENVDDVQRNWRINEFAFAIARNLNDSFTSRGKDEYLYQVPFDAKIEARHQVVESTLSGVPRSILSIRKKEPNVHFMFSIENVDPKLLKNITVPVNHGQGRIVFKGFQNTEQLLRYFSTQFETILMEQPLEKAALIFDKFLFGRSLGNLGISLSAVQSVKDELGKVKVKILNIGNTGVVVVKKKDINDCLKKSVLKKIKSFHTSTLDIEKLAQETDITISDLKNMKEKNKRNIIIGRLNEKMKTNKLLSDIKFFQPINSHLRLGMINQVPHQITEINFDTISQSFFFISPSLVKNVQQLNKQTDFSIKAIKNQWIKNEKTNVSIKEVGFSEEKIGIDRKIKWTSKTINPQVRDFLQEITNLAKEFELVDIFLQHSHIHPTQSKHSLKQEHGAEIAKYIADQLKEIPNIKIKSGTLVDEYHTADLMTDYRIFNEKIKTIAGNMYTGLFTESSPAMNFIAKSIARIYLEHKGTGISGGVVTHDMDGTGHKVEIWDSVTDSNGIYTKGRCACVPFEIGMNILLMEHELTHELYIKYLLFRFPKSELANLVNMTLNHNSDELLVENTLFNKKNILLRNEHRMRLLSEVDVNSFDEVANARADITGFDIYALDTIYRKIVDNIKTRKRIPVVIHVLESNYAGQQTKSGWSWENRVGIPGIEIWRISFDSGRGSIDILKSKSPKEDYMGNFLNSKKDLIKKLANIITS